jgi:hypothetical protein
MPFDGVMWQYHFGSGQYCAFVSRYIWSVSLSLSYQRPNQVFGCLWRPDIGSGLIDQIQKMTTAALQMADRNAWAQRS